MEKKIIYTENFKVSLKERKDYLETEWSFEVAEKFILELYELIDLLSIQAGIGSPTKKKNIRKILFAKYNRLYYRITSKSIILLELFDTRRNPKHNKYE